MKNSPKKEVKRSRSASKPTFQPKQFLQALDVAAPSVQEALSLLQRAVRDKRGEFLVEGLRNVNLALEYDALRTLFYSSRVEQGERDLVERVRAQGVRCLRATPDAMRRLTQSEEPQNLVAMATRRPLKLEEVEAQKGLWVALESVRKPGNLGSILRTCEAVGAQGVIAVGPHVDFFAPGVVRAAMGAFWTQRLVIADWDTVFAAKHRYQLQWVGTSPSATLHYDAPPYGPDHWLWMGDERLGLSARVLNACQTNVSIPLSGRVDSLNLGVATGILLFEIRRQRVERGRSK